jgi:transcriptional regulator with XRE-family HTH domain
MLVFRCSVKFPMGTERRFRNSIGPQLRRLRTGMGLTQDALAGKLQRAGLDMDRTAVAKIETRLRSVFDFELAMIARVLKVGTDELLPNAAALDSILPDLMRGSIPAKRRKTR